MAAWRKDIAALAPELAARHPAPWRTCPRADFERRAAELADRVPTLPNDEIAVGVATLVAALGDGHTSVALDSVPTAPARLPLRIAWLDDGPFVAAVGEENRALLGARIEAVGNALFATAAAAVVRTVAIDNDAVLRVHAASLLTDLRVLHAVGLSPRDRVAIVARAANGSLVRAELRPTTPAQRWSTLPPADTAPQSLRARPEWFWWQQLPDAEAVYLRADRCADDPPAGESFSAVVAAVDRHLDTDGRGRRVVLDLRFNPGGNDKALGALFRLVERRPQLRRHGNLLVLIGRRTFSSAGLVALWLREHCGAVLVGEPAGMKPNSFGQVRDFALPCSRLLVHCSTRAFRFVDGDPPSLLPDVAVPLTSAILRDGRDAVLDAALAVPVDDAR